jgi:hypothetical protein
MNDIIATYIFAKPALRPVLLSVELTSSSIKVYSFREEKQRTLIHDLPYAELQAVNMSPIDINNNQLTLSFASGAKIEVNSFSTARLQDGKAKRDDVDQTAAFDVWVSDLHQMLLKQGPAQNIRFSEGSDAKQLVLALMLAACCIGAFAAWNIGRLFLASVMVGGAAMVAALLFRMGSSKEYLPASTVRANAPVVEQHETL